MSDDLSTIISKNIKSLLLANNINQNDLAKILGVSDSSVGKWILGHNMPKMGTIQKIADYFHINKSDILENEIKSNNNVPSLHELPLCSELSVLCKRLNENGQKKAIEYVKFLLTDEDNNQGFTDSNLVAG